MVQHDGEAYKICFLGKGNRSPACAWSDSHDLSFVYI
jgi:hypothetical protein